MDEIRNSLISYSEYLGTHLEYVRNYMLRAQLEAFNDGLNNSPLANTDLRWANPMEVTEQVTNTSGGSFPLRVGMWVDTYHEGNLAQMYYPQPVPDLDSLTLRPSTGMIHMVSDAFFNNFVPHFGHSNPGIHEVIDLGLPGTTVTVDWGVPVFDFRDDGAFVNFVANVTLQVLGSVFTNTYLVTAEMLPVLTEWGTPTLEVNANGYTKEWNGPTWPGNEEVYLDVLEDQLNSQWLPLIYNLNAMLGTSIPSIPIQTYSAELIHISTVEGYVVYEVTHTHKYYISVHMCTERYIHVLSL